MKYMFDCAAVAALIVATAAVTAAFGFVAGLLLGLAALSIVVIVVRTLT
jgi:hypothetical protein